MGTALTFIWENWATILNSLSAVVAACSAIAALTKTPHDDRVLGHLRNVVDLLGMNWGHAGNRR